MRGVLNGLFAIGAHGGPQLFFLRMTFRFASALSLALMGSVFILPPPGARAETISLLPVADTTLFEVAPNNNLGGADFFNAGTAGNGNRNRALLRFDFSESLPPGAVITRAELTLEIVRQPRDGAANSFFGLRRTLQAWGEGAQVPAEANSPGLGAPAGTGEATWNAPFAGGSLWLVAGGHFSDSTSGLAPGGNLGGQLFFESTSALVADLQRWVDHPEENFGWTLASEDEETGKTARSFASRESGFGPLLTLQYAVVPEPAALSLVGLFLLLCAAIKTRARR